MKLPTSPQLVVVGAGGAVDEETLVHEGCAVIEDAPVVPVPSCTPSVTVVGAAVMVVICLEASEVWDNVLGGTATERACGAP